MYIFYKCPTRIKMVMTAYNASDISLLKQTKNVNKMQYERNIRTHRYRITSEVSIEF